MVALAVRLLPYRTFFRPDGVLLAADGDTAYHALRAERLARDWPHVPWTDPGMNHPLGARIPWPPLLDQLVATVAVATGPATPDHVAAVAALLPPILGAAVVLLAALVGSVILGGGAWWEAALLLALLPAAVRQGFVGRADHHVLEVLLSLAALLAYGAALRRERAGIWLPAALGVALALAFWNWPGSALTLALLAGHVGVLHLVSSDAEGPRRAAGALARGALVAAGLLAISIAAWGPPGALLDFGLTPITGLSVGLCLLTAAGTALIGLLRRRDPTAGMARRALHLVVACLPALAWLAVPPLNAGLVHGLTAVGASSAWYATIAEFWPLLGSGRQPLTRELWLALFAYGLTPLALLAVVGPFRRAWARDPERRASLVLFAVWLAATVVLAALRRRFEGYAIVPLALASAWALRDGLDRLARSRPAWAARLPATGAAGLLLVALPGLPVSLSGAVGELPAGCEEKLPLFRWLRGVPALPGREGVMAPWSEGHEIQWLARKPVVSTPFGTDIDPSSVQDQVAFFLASDPAAADALLRRRQVGFLLLDSPIREIATMAPFAPGSPPLAVEERSLVEGSTYAMRPELFDLVVARLYFFDGLAQGGDRPSLGSYRLLAESRTTVRVMELEAQAYKLFGVVEGARLTLRGLPPGAPVAAAATIRTGIGREFQWQTTARADAGGTAVLRVPYATGANGTSTATPFRVGDRSRSVEVSVTEAEVAGGSAVEVKLR